MIIERLHLRNFGIYGGSHNFDLAPDPEGDKPIVLVEGHNGSGKTTFLEAIRLALYGKAALGSRVSQKAYEGYLRERLYRGGDGDEIEISLILRRRENGAECRYAITRRWQINRTGTNEDLKVAVDNTVPLELSAVEWQDVLNDMVPPGVSQLFFFDGEKIQDIAQSDASAGLQQAIRPLLGLDIIEQLRSDLALFVARQKMDGSPGDLDAAKRDLTVCEAALIDAEEARAQLASELDQANARMRRAEASFRKEGGRRATGEDDAKHERQRSDEERQELLHELRELASGIGPLLLAPNTLRRLDDAVASAELQQAKMAATRLLKEFEAQSISRSVRQPAIWLQFREFIATDAVPLPGWAKGNLDYLRRRIAATAEAEERERCRRLSDRLDRNFVETQAAEEQLEAFAKGIGDAALDAIREAEFERGRLSAELEEQNLLVSRLRTKKDRARVRCERLHDEVFETAKLDRSAALAGKARAALITYEERILAGRIAALEEHVLACLHRLLRRPTLVGRVQLDPDSFDIALVGSENRPIALASLSAGERQLFAVALLWALAKTSERALPLVIDTPLGRLDRMHRERIISQYLAGASEQVVLLCTDTELTSEVAAQLQPFVSRHLSLGVNEEAGRTGVTILDDATVTVPTYAAL